MKAPDAVRCLAALAQETRLAIYRALVQAGLVDELVVYLAAHGTNHGWSRLKWLADFAAFLAAQPPAVRRVRWLPPWEHAVRTSAA
mgnify:CR=1 FL=1